jgi:hypothetical protein
METASWVIRNKVTKEVIMETFSATVVAAVNTAKYEAVPILAYLQEVNRTIRAHADGKHAPKCVRFSGYAGTENDCSCGMA